MKLTFIADTHHYSKTLGTTGRQYQLRSGSDQKCLAETREIIEAAFEKIASSDTDCVLIAGDVTNDGERASHYEFKEMLYKLKEKKPVYLITATHDWCNDLNPRRYHEDTVYKDVPTMNARELPDFYKDFGPDAAISKYITHIGTCSYVVQVGDNVRVLALNDDKNQNYHAGFTEEHFQWIEEQIRNAQADGCLMIGMEHHLLMPHISSLITGGGACVADRDYVASRLADAGLKYMFVGHSHLQSTAKFTSDKGNTITEVNVGSLVGYPAPIVNVTVNDDLTLSYEVERLEYFTLNGEKVDAQEFLKKHATDLVDRVLQADSRKEFQDRMTALQTNGEKLGKYYKLLKPIFNWINTITIGELYNKLKKFGLSKIIYKPGVDKYYHKKLLDFVHEIMLSVFDGSVNSYSRQSDYYKLVMSVISIPNKLPTRNNDTRKLIEAFDAILTGGSFNNQKDTI